MSTEALPDRPGNPALARILLAVFAPFAFGYFLTYLFRSVNAVIAPDLIAEVGLNAAELGLLTSGYFFAYALAQLPLGLALDRFGPRRVQATLFLCSAAGAFVFAQGGGMASLTLGRILIGIGTAGGLMASFKAIALWFPQQRWPLVNGCFMTVGGLGALAATAPVEAALQLTDWRGLFAGLGAATLLVAAVIFLVVPEKPVRAAPGRIGDQFRDLARIFSDRLFWRVAPVACSTLSVSIAIQSLWAGPWLRDVAGLGRPDVAKHLMLLAASLTLGFLITGVVADLLVRLGVRLGQMLVAGVLLFLLAQAGIVLQLDPQGHLLWMLFGVCGSSAMVAYPMLSQHFPPEYSGRANTAINLLVFGGAFLCQSAVGAVVELWPPVEGRYPAIGYSVAFGCILAVQAAALAWLLRPAR